MKLQCPKCRRELPPDDVDVVKETAFCRACQRAFATSPDAPMDDVDLSHPPEGLAVRAMPNGFVLSARSRNYDSWHLILVVPCLPLAAMFLLKAGFLADDHLPFPGFRFLLVFLLVVVALGAVAGYLYGFWGRVVLAVNGHEGAVFTGFGRLGRTRRFDLRQVTRVRETVWLTSCRAGTPGSPGSMGYYIVVLEGPRPIEFGMYLATPHRRYMMAALRRQLAVVQPSP